MNGTPLLIGPVERAGLHELRERAARAPVDMHGLTQRLKDPAEKARHREQMTAQSVRLPLAYVLTYSVETGHPGGTARHMSMSVSRSGRVPTPEAVWMVAEALGFTGGLERCVSWQENLEGHGTAINVVQFVQPTEKLDADIACAGRA
jgi:hypothetical protein